MLVAYGVVAAYAFGLLMNLSGWPFVLGIEVPGHEGSLAFVPGDAAAGEPAPLRRLHAAHLDRQLGHRPRDHQRGGDRRARPGGAHDAAPGLAPGDGHRRRDDGRRVAPVVASGHAGDELEQQRVHAVGLLHLEEVAAAQLDVRRSLDARGGGGHVAGPGHQVEGARDEDRGQRDAAERDAGVAGGAEREVGVPVDRGREELADRQRGELGVRAAGTSGRSA